jgi:transposase
VGGKPGRPRELPDAAYADRGYDNNSTRALLKWLGVEPKIAKRRTSHGSGLGKVRWVVERTIGWLKGLRRMRVRYDRLGVIQEAWNTLAAATICFNIACHDCTT